MMRIRRGRGVEGASGYIECGVTGLGLEMQNRNGPATKYGKNMQVFVQQISISPLRQRPPTALT